MTNVAKTLNQLAISMADEQIKNGTMPPSRSLTDALTEFEQNASLVATVQIGGLSSPNAVTQRLQQSLNTHDNANIPTDGKFGPRTAAKLLGAMDENNLNITDYPEIDAFLAQEHPELREEFLADQTAETQENAQDRNALIASISENLSTAFDNTKHALLDRYFNKDVLRTEIEAHIEEGATRAEITDNMMEPYKEIMATLPNAIETEIQDILEGQGVDIDTFAMEQITETFQAIDADEATRLQQEAPPPSQQWSTPTQAL